MTTNDQKQPRCLWSALVLSAAIVIAMAIAVYGVIHRNDRPRTVSVKGMASRDFSSDLIVWECHISTNANTPQQGFETMNEQKNKVLQFLKGNGIEESEIETLPMQFHKSEQSEWDGTSQRWITVQNGYDFSQRFKVTSNDLAKVEAVSRKIPDLLKDGVMIQTDEPSYYYTKLSELKLEMLGEAAEDARSRALSITKKSKASLGKLKSSSMGVFQIQGRNSNDEYTWGGVFNTREKEKTAVITVSSVFMLK